MLRAEELFEKFKALKDKRTEELSAKENTVVEFVTRVLDFYKVFDIHEHTDHSRAIKLLFLDGRKLSGENIARKMFVSVKTLYRFKRQYLDFVVDALEKGVFGVKIGQFLTDF